MGRFEWIAAGIIGGAAGYMLMTRRFDLRFSGIAANDGGFSFLRVGFSGGAAMMLDKSFSSARWMNAAAVDDEIRFHPNVVAFFRVIRECESNQSQSAYYLLNGGQAYTKANGYPRDLIDGPHPAIVGKGGSSTAAGAYQCVIGTWREMSQMRRLGENAQMTPANQEKIALALCAWRGALPAIIAGDLEGAYAKLGNEWEGLPSGGKPTRTKSQLRAVFMKYGGTLAAGQ
jgi:muramidase (phage lysozyme)